ncbi:MAG: sulfatase-like hydrolase/transferase [Pusillimonas sp.]
MGAQRPVFQENTLLKMVPALCAAGFAVLALTSCDSSNHTAANDDPEQPPNIVFVIMDDVGIDQMASFGYGGLTKPKMPNMDAIAAAGIRFRNTWSMPECSPGRAAFFLGQYPTRTNIYQAIGPNDVANSQVSPYAMTAPKLLKQAGYESAMFGKFHLAGPENNEAENTTPSVLGWDYFYGWIGGLPGSVDTTAGGVAPDKTYSCGFVPGKPHVGGANTGACYYADNSCTNISHTSPSQDAAGLQCLDSGGIFVRDEVCGVPPGSLDFNRENAYYVSPLVIIDGASVEEVPLSDPRSRGYRTRIETDAAIDWIKSRPADKPWMATVSYSSAHTPWQQPPGGLVSSYDGIASNGLDCTGTVAGRLIQDKMIEAMDTEFGRLMVETGMAQRATDGSLVYDPGATNTVIVIVGDNGSLGSAVKPPFQFSQAKGTAYQTGVWDPLIIAGPQVEQPDREVGHMVNTVDLFQFFGELAGIDVPQAVPQTIDSASVLPYLTNPDQASLRTINFTIGGVNQQAHGGRNGPCVVGGSCTQIPTGKSVCEDNQGVWWGPGYTDNSVVDNGGKGYLMCGEVNQALYKAQQPLIDILAETSMAVRNDDYKLVRNITQTYEPATDSFGSITTEELYQIDQAAPTPLLDTPDLNLLLSPTPQIQGVYDDLLAKLDDILASSPDCPGDGNLDGVVDGKDLAEWSRIARNWGLSSVYDFMVGGVHDGLTNNVDEAVIQSNLGKTCEKSYALR